MKNLLFLTILLQPPLQVAGDLQAVLVDQAAAALASVTHAAVVFVFVPVGCFGCHDSDSPKPPSLWSVGHSILSLTLHCKSWFKMG